MNFVGVIKQATIAGLFLSLLRQSFFLVVINHENIGRRRTVHLDPFEHVFKMHIGIR